MEKQIGGTRLRLTQGDLTGLAVDAIVNAANSALQLGGGVAGAIRRRGGDSIQRECDRLGGAPVGTAVLTGAGELPAGHVIHAVGPRWGEGQEDRKLAEAIRASLRIADRHGFRSLALPAVSTGIYGFPLPRAAGVILAAAADYLRRGEHSLEEVIFCLYDEAALREFERALGELD